MERFAVPCIVSVKAEARVIHVDIWRPGIRHAVGATGPYRLPELPPERK